MSDPIFIIGREPAREAGRLLGCEPRAAVLLLGRALFLSPEVFGDRAVYALEEEMQELGLEGKLPPSVKPLPAGEVLQLILERRVVNFG